MEQTNSKQEPLSFDVFGLWCSSCSLSLEKKLQNTPGIAKASVSFSTGQASIIFESGADSMVAVKTASGLGYSLLPPFSSTDSNEYQQVQKQYLIRLAIVGFSSMWATAMSVAFYLGEGVLFLHLSALLAIPGIFYGLVPFVRAAFVSLQSKVVTFDVLVAVANISLLAVSTYNLFFGFTGTFFESIAMTLFIVLFARYLESRLRFQARSNILQALTGGMRPVEVLVGNDWHSAELRSVRIGRHYRVQPGVEIPFDSEILENEGWFDTAILTGESRPVFYGKGDKVLAGSRFLMFGSGNRTNDTYLALKVSETIGGRWIDRQALSSIGRSEDDSASLFHKLSRYWAPAALSAALVFAGASLIGSSENQSLINAISVFASILLVTCPCSLILAEPLSMVWLRRAGASIGKGIVFQRPIRFHRFFRLFRKKIIFFDKTGTLVGAAASDMKLVIFDELSSFEKEKLIETICECILPHPHPTTSFLFDLVSFQGRQRGKHTYHPGRGVEWCGDDGLKVRVGSVEWISSETAVNSDLMKFKNLVEVDGHVVAGIGLRDGFSISSLSIQQIKMLKELRKHGYEVVLLSGDKAITGESLQEQENAQYFDACEFGKSHEEKATIVQAYRNRDYFVGFVGDGVNDLSAMEKSDLAIVVKSSQTITQNAAHCVINQDQVALVSKLLMAVKSAYDRQRLGFLFGLSYNIVMIPLAVFGFVHPLAAAAAMGVSSLLITFFILRRDRE
jgi:Cu2+-exporting ATPase